MTEITVGVPPGYIYIGLQETELPASEMLRDPSTFKSVGMTLLCGLPSCAAVSSGSPSFRLGIMARLLMATLSGKHGSSQVFMLADVLLEQNSAFTLFDHPLRPAVVSSGLWVFGRSLRGGCGLATA